MNSRYSKILNDCEDDWQSFFEAVLSDTNLESDDKIRVKLRQLTIDEVESLFARIKEDTTIKDTWQCRYKLHSLLNIESQDRCECTRKLDDILNSQEEKDRSPSRINIIGGGLKKQLKPFLHRIAVSVKSKAGGVFVVVGPERSGKTTILTKIAQVTKAGNISAHTLDYVIAARKHNDDISPELVIIDNIDDEFSKGLDMRMLMSLKKAGTRTTIVVSCTDPSVVGKLSVYSEPRILNIPDYSHSEMVDILSGHRYYNTYLVSDKTSYDVISMLKRGLETNVLSSSFEIIHYMFFFEEEYSVEEHGISSFPRQSILRAVSACTGRNIDIGHENIISEIRGQIRRRIKGQDEAVERILPVLANIKMGLLDPTKPLGVILAVGPTGVGKTELGRVISDILFDGVYYKEDMNTYFEKHLVAKLIGSPPGYTGSQDIPPMLSFISTKKRGILSLDEIEKAHPAVRDIIMEAIDTGWMKDACGRVYDMRGFLVYMTSNAGCDLFEGGSGRSIGFGRVLSDDMEYDTDGKQKLISDGYFTKSFLGRTDVIFFHELTNLQIREIAYSLVDEMVSVLESSGIDVTDIVSSNLDNLVDMVVAGFDKESGARSMQSYVRYELTRYVLELNRIAETSGVTDDKTLEVQ